MINVKSLQFRYGMLAASMVILVSVTLGSLLITQYQSSFKSFSDDAKQRTQQYLLNQVKQQGISLSAILAENLKNPIYDLNMKQILHIINAAKDADNMLNVVGNVKNIVIYDTEGRVVHDGLETIPTFGQLIATGDYAPVHLKKSAPITETQSDSIRVWRSVWIEDLLIGGLMLEISLETVQRNLARITEEQNKEYSASLEQTIIIGFMTSLLLIVLGVLITVMSARRIVDPIKEVAVLANQIGEDNYKKALTYEHQDEIGELVDSFNNMSERLDQAEDERERSQNQLEYMALYDALTTLPNRTLLMDRLNHLLNQSERQQTKFLVIFIDLDDFKKVNDTLGHDSGDELLIELAVRLKRVIRSQDSVGRLSGDEFLCLLGDLHHINDGNQVLDKIINVFKTPFVVGGRNLMMTASIGISVYPNDGNISGELLKKADSAMYHSKKIGRNTFSYFSAQMNQNLARRLAVEEQMHSGIDKNEYTVVYQPKVRLSDEIIVGFEALLRWNNSELDDINPEEFIPIAEQTGFIDQLGDFVFHQAAKDIQTINHLYGTELNVAINVSPRQLRQNNFIESINDYLALDETSVRNIDLEITEGVLMSGIPNIHEQLKRLSQSGIQIVMDDFGTGYSSLSYLRNYPFNVLKIDRSFIQDIGIDDEDDALIKAIVNMSHSLNIEVIAEGAETLDQVNYLKQIGCDYVQGFYFGKPMSLDELQSRIKTHRNQFGA